ncbi:MSMEG_0567/sll0787 family protein [Nocardioides cavernaquae]|uniref:AIR synthase n=1 Tax=Nocardioides cavernaquae TaxID=2321396 RepID=A0A3A5H560_9ACTN|nr:MSMEG_0567/sll0787 family protein [Nocardioides cavernaquae]RJS45712.1 AIR synthase [Nocardioides cavernaquae]
MITSLTDVILAGTLPGPTHDHQFLVVRADAAERGAYLRLREDVFIREQALFSGSDRDHHDEDLRTIVLVARTPDGTVLGGVRIHPMTDPDLGWWRGSRLAVMRGARGTHGVGVALIRAACAAAEEEGALRFDAVVQEANERIFTGLGWIPVGRQMLRGRPHIEFEWPIARIQNAVNRTKAILEGIVGDLLPRDRWTGDDGVPVPGSSLVAACDAILPSMVERDPEWAGWCSVLVNVNDLFAMGATPVGLLDAVAGRDASFVRRIVRGIAEASRAWDVPVLGGHTQVGVPGALSVTALGHATNPVPGGGAAPGQRIRVTADLDGSWRPGYTGGQWDTSSRRTGEELRALGRIVPALAPTAAKDVSMAGLVGTTGMLAEASGCRVELEMSAVPRPHTESMGDWATCFPGFAMVTAEIQPSAAELPHFVTSNVCGIALAGTGVGLRWPDGRVTDAVQSSVTGLGHAFERSPS